MVGDPQQLPPTVRCQQAQRLGLGTSLFERVQAMGLKPLLLDTQYRMHPALAEFPSARFYGGLLRSWPSPADRPLPAGLPWPNAQVGELLLLMGKHCLALPVGRLAGWHAFCIRQAPASRQRLAPQDSCTLWCLQMASLGFYLACRRKFGWQGGRPPLHTPRPHGAVGFAL